MTEGQAYQIDLDPVHSVIRLTVTAETVTLELAEDIYRHLSEAASSGAPYAAIFDFSAAKHYELFRLDDEMQRRLWDRVMRRLSCAAMIR